MLEDLAPPRRRVPPVDLQVEGKWTGAVTEVAILLDPRKTKMAKSAVPNDPPRFGELWAQFDLLPLWSIDNANV